MASATLAIGRRFRPVTGAPGGVTIDPTWALLIGILAGGGVFAISAVAFTLVPTLRQLQRTAAAIEAVARKIDGELEPTIHEAKGLVRDVATLTRRVDGDLKVVSRIVEDVSDTTAYAKQLAAAMKTEAERPLLGIVSALAGFRRAADAYKSYREKTEAPRNPFRKR